MKEILKTIKLNEKEDLNIQMVVYMKEIGKTIKKKEKE
jgi:hypothetical protein